MNSYVQLASLAKGCLSPSVAFASEMTAAIAGGMAAAQWNDFPFPVQSPLRQKLKGADRRANVALTCSTFSRSTDFDHDE